MGQIRRVAGTGSPGGGDEGSALATALSRPDGVAVSADGHVLITHTSDHTVRMVSAEDGAVTRVTADGGFLIASPGNHTVRKVTPSDG